MKNKNLKNINIEKFSKELWPVAVKKIQERVSKHRAAMRINLNSRQLNLLSIASLVPFFLGFYNLLNQNQQIKKIVFQKNIPGFSLPTEIMNWDTLRYFSIHKKDFFRKVEQVHWSPNSLYFIKIENKVFTDQESFITNIKSFSKDNDRMETSESSSLLDVNNVLPIQNFGRNTLLLKSVNNKPVFSLLQKFYLNLDEIPLRIENINLDKIPESSSFDSNDFLFSQKDQDQSKFVKSTNLPFQEKVWLKNTKESFLTEKKNTNVDQSIKKLLINPGSVFDENKVFKKQATGLKNIKIEKDLKKPNQMNSPQTLGLFSTLKDFSSFNGDSESILKQLKEEGLFYSRKMSGYEYPDMNSHQVSNLLLHTLFSNYFQNSAHWKLNESTIKIVFPANLSFITEYSFENQKIPLFRIKNEKVALHDLKTKTFLYDENSIYLSTNLSFDWKVEYSSQNSLEKWIENYFSPLNPLTHEKLYPPNIPSEKTQSSLEKPIKLKKPFAGFQSEKDFLIPYLTTEQWNKFYNEMENPVENLVFDTNFKILQGSHLPVVEFSNLGDKEPTLNFDFNANLDYNYSLQKFHPNLNIQSCLSDIFFPQNGNSISYKKILSSFNKLQFLERPFSDSWEPLTIHSWLLISQIGFAFWVFHFCKSMVTEYFKELIWFIVEIGFSVGIVDANLKEEIELITGQRDKGFRVIAENKKRFKDIAGMKALLPEIAEIVWFLRNSGKEFSLSKNFPRGLLLIGPPGTGKTLLVQALAGEADVPVLALSGSSIEGPGGSGGLKLEMLFQEARTLSPCIVFIDEIDTLGQKRTGVLENPMGGDEVFSALNSVDISDLSFDRGESQSLDFLNNPQTSFFQKRDQISNLPNQSTEFAQQITSKNIAGKIKQKIHAQEKHKNEELKLLTQLLIELDGLQGRKGIVVIGATNRPEMVDSALLRPGRFDKIVELGLPGYQKRVEIFKLYGGILGFHEGDDENFSTAKTCWEYFSRRTMGFTAADLASIMNQSSLKAILIDEKNPKHTVKTIEHGIDRIITSEIEKPKKKGSHLVKQRLAYYQAGKIVLSTILEYHPPTLVSYLWPRRQNRRSLQIFSNLQKYFFQFARRCELEDQIVGSYGGKAAEILFLQKSHSPSNLSTFGLEDLSFAFVLICFTIEKWYLYSKSTLISYLSQIILNKNLQELIPEKIELFKELACSLEFSPSLFSSHESLLSTQPFSQNLYSNAWWQLHISQELEFVERIFADWYRIYLPNPQETEMNIEWSPPDDFYHSNLLNKPVTTNTAVTWNDLHKITRDYQVQSFVFQSFNKALVLLDQNREYLDKLVFELLQKEILHQPEIEKISSNFILSNKQTPEKSTTTEFSAIKIVDNSFGKWSRRKIKNWIDFKDFEN